jgi:hypothetical protein
LVVYAEKDMVTEDHLIPIARQIPDAGWKSDGLHAHEHPLSGKTIRILRDFLYS